MKNNRTPIICIILFALMCLVRCGTNKTKPIDLSIDSLGVTFDRDTMLINHSQIIKDSVR